MRYSNILLDVTCNVVVNKSSIMHKSFIEIKELLNMCETFKYTLKIAKCHSTEAIEYANKIWKKG